MSICLRYLAEGFLLSTQVHSIQTPSHLHKHQPIHLDTIMSVERHLSSMRIPIYKDIFPSMPVPFYLCRCIFVLVDTNPSTQTQFHPQEHQPICKDASLSTTTPFHPHKRISVHMDTSPYTYT
jgi:hypothetical protein